MSNKEIKSLAKEKLSGNLITYILVLMIVGFVSGLLNYFSFIVMGPLTLGVTIFGLKVVRSDNPEVGNAFEGFSNFKNSFILSIVYYFKIFLWTLLFIVPGIIKAYSYSMSYYVLADNPEMSGSEAIAASVEMMQGHKMDLFKLQLSFLGWYLLGFVTFGIAFLYVSPYVSASTAVFYDNLKNNA